MSKKVHDLEILKHDQFMRNIIQSIEKRRRRERFTRLFVTSITYKKILIKHQKDED